MEVVGINQEMSTSLTPAIIVAQTKKLLELQGELLVELIESAKVPGSADKSSVPGLGTRIDLHV